MNKTHTSTQTEKKGVKNIDYWFNGMDYGYIMESRVHVMNQWRRNMTNILELTSIHDLEIKFNVFKEQIKTHKIPVHEHKSQRITKKEEWDRWCSPSPIFSSAAFSSSSPDILPMITSAKILGKKRNLGNTRTLINHFPPN